MLKVSFWMAACVALAFVLTPTTPSRAADAPAAGGTIKGKVVDKQGNAVAKAHVRLMTPPPKENGKQPAADPTSTVPPAQRKAGGGPGKRPAVAETDTDDKGEFTLNNVAPGNYVVWSGVPGTGVARERVSVKQGDSVNVTLTLKPHEPGKGGGGAGHQGGAGKQG